MADGSSFFRKQRARDAAAECSDDCSPMHKAVREHLRELTHTLRLMTCVTTASSAALRNQNADLDEDIATVLDHSCTAPLRAALTKTEALLANLDHYRA